MHCVIGCGRAAINHVFGLNEYGQTEFSCYDRDVNIARAFAAKHGVPLVANSLEEILQSTSINSVSICTDHASHAPLAMRMLNAGKHVLVEKPIALSVSDADSMIALANSNGLILSVVSQHRYDKIARVVGENIKMGTFGRITMATGFLQCNKEKDYYEDSSWRGRHLYEGGSVLINQAIHTLDLLVGVLGKPCRVSTLQSNLKFSGIIETEDTLVSALQFDNGALGSFVCTNTSMVGWDSKVEFVGTKGSVGFTTGFPIRLTTYKLPGDTEGKLLSVLKTIEAERELPPPSLNYYGVSHKYQIANFLDCIAGKGALYMRPDCARDTLAVVLDMYNQSSRPALAGTGMKNSEFNL